MLFLIIAETCLNAKIILMSLPNPETVKTPEVPASIYDLREGIIDIFEAGVSGTEEKISEVVKHERGTHTAATLLGYSGPTFKSLQIFGASLMGPEEFELRHIQNGEIQEVEIGDIIYAHGDMRPDKTIRHYYTRPITSLVPHDPLRDDYLSSNLTIITNGTNPHKQPVSLNAYFLTD